MTSSTSTHTLKLNRALRHAQLANSNSTVAAARPPAGRNVLPDQANSRSTAIQNNETTREIGSTGPTQASSQPQEVAQTKHVSSLLKSLNDSLGQFAESRQETTATVHQIAVELAVTIAGKVLFEQIQADQFPIERMVVEMLKQIDTAGPVTVFINPLDLKLVQQAIQAKGTDAVAIEGVKWIASAELPRGSARLDTDKVALFYDAATQLSEIRQNLMEMLQDAEIERRKTQVEGAGLRRFPDRRASG